MPLIRNKHSAGRPPPCSWAVTGLTILLNAQQRVTLGGGLLRLCGSAHGVTDPCHSGISPTAHPTLTQGDTGHTLRHSPCPPVSARWPERSPRSPCGACISGNLLWKTSLQGRAHSHSPRLWCHSHRTGQGGRGYENTASDCSGLHGAMLAVSSLGCPPSSNCKGLTSPALSLSLLLSASCC